MPAFCSYLREIKQTHRLSTRLLKFITWWASLYGFKPRPAFLLEKKCQYWWAFPLAPCPLPRAGLEEGSEGGGQEVEDWLTLLLLLSVASHFHSQLSLVSPRREPLCFSGSWKKSSELGRGVAWMGTGPSDSSSKTLSKFWYSYPPWQFFHTTHFWVFIVFSGWGLLAVFWLLVSTWKAEKAEFYISYYLSIYFRTFAMFLASHLLLFLLPLSLSLWIDLCLVFPVNFSFSCVSGEIRVRCLISH